jgi:hypothetical protein
MTAMKAEAREAILIVAGNFNCHHLVYNSSQYSRYDEVGKDLVELATDYCMTLLLPSGTVPYPQQ